jgi:hypothetical protein
MEGGVIARGFVHTRFPAKPNFMPYQKFGPPHSAGRLDSMPTVADELLTRF